jgi:death-on-curing protein
MFGEELYAGVPSKAAALCQAIVRAHPFTDGNKRVALVALDLFLEANGAALTATNDEAYTVIMALARGEMEHARLVAWVEQRSSEL